MKAPGDRKCGVLVRSRMKTTLVESFPGTCPAGVSLLRLSALDLFWHPWVPPHDLAPIDKKILSCEVPLDCMVCADCPFSVKLPDPRENTSSLVPASLLQTSYGGYVYPSLVQMQNPSLSITWGDQPRTFLPSQDCCRIANVFPAGAEPRASCPAGEVWVSPSCPCLGQRLVLSPLSTASPAPLYVGRINPSCPQACSRNSAEPPPSVATTATGAGRCRARQPQPAPRPRGFGAISGQLARSCSVTRMYPTPPPRAQREERCV